MKTFLICLFYILVIFAGYTFVSLISYKPNRQGMTGKERIELTRIYSPFWKLLTK